MVLPSSWCRRLISPRISSRSWASRLRERLVEQEQARVAHDGAADGDALPLAAGQLARKALAEVADAQHLGGPSRRRFRSRPRRLARAQAEGDVLEHGQVGIERVVLEHHGDVAVARAHVVDHLRRRSRWCRRPASSSPAMVRSSVLLPQPDGPDQHGELAVGDVEVDAAHGVHVAVVLVQPGDLEIGHCRSP